MSATASPSRLGRGVAVAGIDTSGSNKPMTALSIHGCLTPPQSAHESRRGSLAYGSLADAAFAYQDTSYSLPTTPDDTTAHAIEAYHSHWEQPGQFTQPETSTTCTRYTQVQMQSADLKAVLDGACTQSELAVRGLTQDLTSTMCYSTSNGSHGVWITDGHAGHGALGEELTLRPSLFRNPEALPSTLAGHGVDFPYREVPSHGMIVSTACVSQYSPTVISSFHQPQVVVPSHLSPTEDIPMHAYSDYSSPVHRDGSTLSSFASPDTAIPSYGCVTPDYLPKPNKFDNIDDCALVYQDTVRTVVPSKYLAPSSPSRPHRPTQPNRTQSKRRSQRRARPRNPMSRMTYLGMEVEYESHILHGRPDNGSTSTTAKKWHKCTQCERKFERSEHLKRHNTKHAPVRRFHCHLPDCKHPEGFTRGDNAMDHFKTHLRNTARGRRNPLTPWPVLRDMLLDETKYEPAEGEKFAKRLEVWIRENRGGEETKHILEACPWIQPLE